MNCEETGLQKSISDSAEMRQVFCKTISHFILSHFFTPFYLLCFHSSSVSSGFTDTLLTTTLPFHQLLSALGASLSSCPFGFFFLMLHFCCFCSPLPFPSFLLCT